MSLFRSVVWRRRARAAAEPKSRPRLPLSRAHFLIIGRLRSDIAAARVRSAYWLLLAKANFREDQPRWPKGSGENSGRWSGGAGFAPPSSRLTSEPKKSGGHHYVPKAVFDDKQLAISPEARAVFKRAVTGSVPGLNHGFSKEHLQYNKAIEGEFIKFVKENRIITSNMTAQQADEFVKVVKNSANPLISRLNNQIRSQIIRFHLRITPRSAE